MHNKSMAWLQSPASIFAHANEVPKLSEAEERAWVLRLPEPRAVEVLMAANLRHVVSLVRKNRGYGLADDELLQAGVEGLLRGLRRIDSQYENRAITFLGKHIKAQIQQEAQRFMRTYASPSTKSTRTLFFYLRSRRSELLAPGQRWLSEAQLALIAQEKGVSVDSVKRSERFFFDIPESFDAPLGDSKEDSALHDVFADPSQGTESRCQQEDQIQKAKRVVDDALTKLTDKQRWVLQQRRLVAEPTTLEELAAALAVSKARVGQVEQEAMKKLTAAVES